MATDKDNERDLLEKWLNALLRRAGWTQTELARELNLSPEHLNRLIHNKKRWSVRYLNRICEILEATDAEKQQLRVLAKLEEPSSLLKVSDQQDKNSTFRVPLQRPIQRAPYFTGRDSEIEKILQNLEPGRVLTLVGPGGIGKSAIAAEVFWRLVSGDKPPDRFPDGVIYYVCYDPDQNTADSVFTHIVTSFGGDPSPTPEAAVRRILDGRKVLFILESAENLINSDLSKVLNAVSGCGVLVTSRKRKTAFDHRYRYDVKPLEVNNSIELMQNWGGKRANNEITVKKICKLIGRFPLAIRLAGSYLAESEKGIDEYMLLLEESPLDVLDTAEDPRMRFSAIMERSLNEVSKEARQVLWIIGLISLVPTDLEIIAKPLGLKIHNIQLALGELVNYSFLERPHEAYKFTHALIRIYARKHIDLSNEVIDRLITPYLALMASVKHTKDEFIFPSNDDIDAILNLLPILAERNKWNEVLQLAIPLATCYLYIKLDSQDKKGEDEYLTISKYAVKAAEEAKNKEREIVSLNLMIIAYQKSRQYDKIRVCYEKIASIAEELNDTKELCSSLYNLSQIYYDLKQPEKAILYFERFLTLTQKFGDITFGPGSRELISFGDIYASQNNFRRAFECYKKALAKKDKDEKELLNELNAVYQVLFENNLFHKVIPVVETKNQAKYEP